MEYPVFTVDQLAAHLQAMRKARGLTQTELGRLLGVKQSRIADIEKDPGAISVAQLHRLIAALGAQLVLREASGGWIGVAEESAAPRKAASGRRRGGTW